MRDETPTGNKTINVQDVLILIYLWFCLTPLLLLRKIFAVTLKHFPGGCYQELVPSLASPCQNSILPNITFVKSCKYVQHSRIEIVTNNRSLKIYYNLMATRSSF